MHDTRATRLVRLFLILFVAFTFVGTSYFTGCGGNKPADEKTVEKDGGGTDSATNTCTVNKDCPAGQACTNGKCEKACNTDAECTGGKKCKANKCVEADTGCKDNNDCPPGKTCKDKQCVEAGTKPAKVEIVTKGGVLRQGQTKQFTARALNDSGAAISGDFKFEWSSSASDIIAIDAATGKATGGSKDGVSNITVKLDGLTSTTVEVRNYAAVAAGKARIIVVDANQKGVSGATVKIGDKEGKTDANGAVTIDGATAPFDVHVFHNDYDYFSAIGANKSDLYVQINKITSSDKAGGAKGKFDFKNVQKLNNISDEDWGDYTVGFGIAGVALSENLLNLDFDLLVGESFKISLFGKDVSLPSGVVVDLAAGGKPNYQSLGETGRKVLWGFGGKFKIDDVLPIVTGATGGDINVGKLLGAAKPLLKSMVFGYKPGVEINQFPRVADKDDKNGDGKTDDLIPDFDKFPEHKIILTNKLSKPININIKTFPKVQWKGKDVDLLSIGLAGVLIPGVGLVPLGLDVDQVKAASGKLTVQYAERTGILKTGKFVTIALTLNISTGKDAPPLMLFGQVKTDKNDITSMDVNSFLDVAKDAKFDPASRKLEKGKVDGATATQLDISDSKGRKWIVYFGAGANGTLTLPAPPSGMDDRAKDAKTVSLRPVKLSGSETLDSILEFNSTNMDQLVHVIAGFSSVEIFEKK